MVLQEFIKQKANGIAKVQKKKKKKKTNNKTMCINERLFYTLCGIVTFITFSDVYFNLSFVSPTMPTIFRPRNSHC